MSIEERNKTDYHVHKIKPFSFDKVYDSFPYLHESQKEWPITDR